MKELTLLNNIMDLKDKEDEILRDLGLPIKSQWALKRKGDDQNDQRKNNKQH